MKNKLFTAVAAMLTAIIMTSNITVIAADSLFDKFVSTAENDYEKTVLQENMLINETFENYATGASTVSFRLIGGLSKIVENDGGKAMCLLPSKSDAFARISKASFSESCFISIRLCNITEKTSFSIGNSVAAKDMVELVAIENGSLKNAVGNKVYTLFPKKKSAEISLHIYGSQFYDIYVDGECIEKNNLLPVKLSEGDVMIKRKSLNEELVIDDFRIYYSDDYATKFPQNEKNTEKFDAAYVDNDNGDHTFFDSTNMNPITYTETTPASYDNFIADARNNIIKCYRLDYQNPDREHSYIYMEKTNANTFYFDVRINRFNSTRDNTSLRSLRPYSYLLIDADYKFDEFCSETYLPYVIDSVSSSAVSAAQAIAVVEYGGSIRLSDGTVLADMVQLGKWFNMKTAFNFISKTADIYIDNKLVYEGLPLNDNIKEIIKVRTQMASNSTTGKLYIDNFTITGLVNPFENGMEQPVSIYSDEKAEQAFLKDKVAFNVNGRLIFDNNKKSIMKTEPIFENDEYYVEYSELSRAFALDLNEDAQGDVTNGNITIKKDGIVTLDNNVIKLEKGIRTDKAALFIPVMEFAKKVLKKSCFYHEETGLLIISDEKLNIDTSEWLYPSSRVITKMSVLNDLDFLSWFMLYERPTGEQLYSDTLKKIGSLDSHPRLMFDKKRIDEILELSKTDEVLKQMLDRFITRADSLINTPVVKYKYNDRLRMATDMATVMRFGLAYNLTGDKKFSERCFKELQAIAEFPDYNEEGTINASAWNIALGLGYDWVYNGLNAQQRDYLSERILNHALKPSAKVYYGRLRGRQDSGDDANYRWISNITSVSASGMFVAAAAVAELDPKYCFDVMSKSLRAYEYPFSMVAPGGGWSEGMSYWNYAFVNTSYSLLTLDTMCGSYYSMNKAKGFNNMQYALSALSGPCGVNPMGDSSSTDNVKSYPAYNAISYVIGDNILQETRMKDLVSKSATPSTEDIIGYHVYDTSEMKPTYISYIPSDEVAAIRQELDPNSTNLYFSTHFAKSSGYHLHTDTGSFIFDILGERWSEDLGKDDYNLQNVDGYKDWELYRKRGEGHNILVINPNPNDMELVRNIFTPIEKKDANEFGGIITADESAIYEDADSVKLGYYIGDNMRSVTVKYELSLNKDSEMYWFMHTRADIVIDGDKAYLYQNGKSICLSFESDAQKAQLFEMKAEPLPTSPQVPKQEKNEEYRKVAIKLTGSGKVNLTVKMAPTGEGIPMDSFIKTPIDEWKLPEKVNNTSWADKLDVRFYADGEETGDNVSVYNGHIPTITAEVSDKSCSVEIDQATELDGKTIVRVYNADKSEYKLYVLKYELHKGSSMKEFVELKVENVEASSEPQPQNGKENMIDNNMATRWTSMSLGQSAIIDLGEKMHVDAVALGFWKSNTRNYYFDLLVSSDGKNYITVYTGQSNLVEESSYNIIDINSDDVRYIKFIGNGNSDTSSSRVNSNVSEFKALKKK